MRKEIIHDHQVETKFTRDRFVKHETIFRLIFGNGI